MLSMIRTTRWASIAVACQLAAIGCLDDVESNPVVELSSFEQQVVSLAPGESKQISVQALDAQGQGQNAAEVAFVVSDAKRIELVAADGGVPELTVLTSYERVSSISADGIALAHVRALDDAPEGDAVVVAVVKQPTDANSAIASRIAVHVSAAEDNNDAGVEP
jgi:hypothetical protein